MPRQPAVQSSATETRVAISSVVALLLFGFLYYFNAYVSDDAFIAFRTIDNFARGEGLRWNVEERVQVFTSPLHTLILSALYWLAYDRSEIGDPGRIYWLSTIYSFALSSWLWIWLAGELKGGLEFWFVFAVLTSSQAFVTFTSSGLETPETYLLVALFYTRFLRSQSPASPAGYLGPFLLAGLAVLNRLDLALLFLGPCALLLSRSYRSFGRRGLWPMLVGLAPIGAWLAFSLVYFGFLLPNTYYAKIGLEVGPGVLFGMGGEYLLASLEQDPITLAIILAGIGSCWFSSRAVLASASAVLYVLYVTAIGGDFLGFRFLTAPFLISTLVLQQAFWRWLGPRASYWSIVVMVELLIYGVAIPSSPLRSFRDPPLARDVQTYDAGGGLEHWRPGARFPFEQFGRIGGAAGCAAARTRTFTVATWGDGLNAFCRGPAAHFIDPHGITDPLLARLEGQTSEPFVAGHVERPLPEGYLESILSGRNEIADPKLAEYYHKLRTVVSGPIWSPERWRYIWQLNGTGGRFRGSYRALEAIPESWRTSAGRRARSARTVDSPCDGC